MVTVLKTVVAQATVGSNPTPTANLELKYPRWLFINRGYFCVANRWLTKSIYDYYDFSRNRSWVASPPKSRLPFLAYRSQINHPS